jgi:D-xylose transport system ATP-binding protein
MTQTVEQAVREDASGVALLQVRNGGKSFGAVHVLRGVDFEARAGEVTALVGDNGAGKSTLIKCIAGIYPLDSSELYMEGQRVHITDPAHANALGIEVVYQDRALCDNMDIVHNLFLGRELSKHGMLDETAMESETSEVLASLSVRIVKSIRQHVSSLSGGQRQTVAIARAVLWNSKVVILDEPTAALGVAQTEQVLNLVRRLADKGLAVVLISHNINEVFEVADSIAVLYLGQMAGQIRASASNRGEVVELITTGTVGSPGLKRTNGSNNGGKA